jgi:hypothetical protein
LRRRHRQVKVLLLLLGKQMVATPAAQKAVQGEGERVLILLLLRGGRWRRWRWLRESLLRQQLLLRRPHQLQQQLLLLLLGHLPAGANLSQQTPHVHPAAEAGQINTPRLRRRRRRRRRQLRPVPRWLMLLWHAPDRYRHFHPVGSCSLMKMLLLLLLLRMLLMLLHMLLILLHMLVMLLHMLLLLLLLQNLHRSAQLLQPHCIAQADGAGTHQ